MLRTLRSPFVAPRVMPFSFSKSGSTFTDNFPGNQTTFTDGGNGLTEMAIRDPFAAPSPMVFGSVVSTAATTPRYVSGRTPATDGKIRLETLSNAGANLDYPAMGFAIGQDSRYIKHTGSLLHTVNGPYAGMMMSAMYVDTQNGVYVNTQGATVTVNGTGDWTITFPVSGAYNLIAVAQAQGGASRRAWVHSTTQNTIRVLMRNNANSAAESSAFNLIFIRLDNKTCARGRKAIKTNQVQPVMLFGRIIYTAGTPSWSTTAPGDGIGTIADTNTGDVTITLPTAFAGLRQGVTIATPGTDATKFCTSSSTSGSTIRIKTWTIAGTDTPSDPDYIDFVTFLYQNTGNYRG